MDYRSYIAKKINIEGFDAEELKNMIIEAENGKGDFALPCFKFAKALRQAPQKIAEAIKEKLAQDEVIQSAEAVNGYLNVFINRGFFAKNLLEEIEEKGESFAASNEGNGKTVVIDYSSVNIAKPFHIGHLSTTVIGAALYRIYKHLGYDCVGVNHLGDWGTQFGKLISAFKRWSSKEEVTEKGIKELLRIYVKFHQEAEKDSKLEEEGRRYFKMIEDGDKEALELFEFFKEITLKEVSKIYDLLNVKFDSYNGESFYNDKMQPVIDKLNEKGLLKDSDGAKIVDLESEGMAPCLILKADGASLYATRDLAAAYYRKQTYNFYKCLYVVAYQQNLHFKQIFKVLELLGEDFAKDMEHVAFGMVSLEGLGALSTRNGNVVFLEDVINSCINKAKEIILQKNPDIDDIDEVAKNIGVGAVVYFALSNNRIKDIVFSIDKVLSFDGETGPYVQYTSARANSILKRASNNGELNYSNITDCEYNLLKELESFKKTIEDAKEKNEPSLITRKITVIAQHFNKFYFEHRILNAEEDKRAFRIMLTKETRTVINTGLKLLGITPLDKM